MSITLEKIHDLLELAKKKRPEPCDDELELDKELGLTEAPENLEEWAVKPIRLEGIPTPPFGIDEAKGGRHPFKVDTLSRILAFIEIAKYRRYADGCTCMPIPTTNFDNQRIWGNKMNVSNARKAMVKLGLIEVYDSYYHPKFRDLEGKSQLFAYFVENEKKLIDYCARHGIKPFMVSNYHAIGPTKKALNIKPEEVRFSANLDLVKPEGMSRKEFEDHLWKRLRRNYPLLEFWEKKVDEINERFYEDQPALRIRFRPKFTWRKYKKKEAVKKIGIRASNSLCSLKQRESDERELFLHEQGYDLKKDVRSSVPRLTLSLNSGHWIDESIDIYELISKEMEPDVEFTLERREAIKDVHMRAYFESKSDAEMGKHIWHVWKKKEIDLAGIVKKDVDETMGCFRKAVRKVEGGVTYGNEIFYVESVVYLSVLYDLLTSGHKVWFVYDAFYGKGGESSEEYEEMVKSGIKLAFEEFLGSKKEPAQSGRKVEDVIKQYGFKKAG